MEFKSAGRKHATLYSHTNLSVSKNDKNGQGENIGTFDLFF